MQAEIADEAAGAPIEVSSDAASIKRRALRSALQSLFGQFGGKALAFGSSVIVSRLVAEADYGTMATIMLVAIGLQLLSDCGVYPALIRHEKGSDESYLATGWTIGVIRGAMLTVAGALLAWPVARFYGRPELFWLLLVTSSTAFIIGLQSIKLVLVQRRMQLGRKIALELTAQVVAFVATVVSAVLLRNVWALVIGWMAHTTTITVLSHVMLPGPRIGLRLDREALHAILRFGRWLFLSTLVTFAASRFDVAVLPKLISEVQFGLYAFALILVEHLRGVTIQLIETVFYPALSATSRRGKEEFQRHFAPVFKILVPSIQLVVGGTAILAPLFFFAFYDDRYAHSAWITQLLMVMLWFDFLQLVLGRTLLALNEPRALLVNNIVRFVGSAAAGYAGYSLAGLAGFTLGLAVGPCIGVIALAAMLETRGVCVARCLIAATLTGAAAVAIVCVTPRILVPWLAPFAGIEKLSAAPWLLPIVTAATGAALLGPFAFQTLRRVMVALRSR